MLSDFIWVEKYRPRTIKETILPERLKSVFQQFVDQKNAPNMILSGKPGVGKTTIARAMLDEIGCDYIMINGSLNGNIDTLRNDITTFASGMSFKGTRKFVIIDEADYLNPNSTQPALRNFMEEFSKNCGFIFTCNNKNRIITPLHSRAPVIEFNFEKKEMPKLAVEFMKRVQFILDKEGVTYQKEVLAGVINKFFPDWRRVLNELQQHAVSGSITTGIFSSFNNDQAKEILTMCKNKEFEALRKWAAENPDIDQNEVFKMIYDNADQYIDKSQGIPNLILKIAEYQYKGGFVQNQEINLLAFFVEVMIDCKFL